MPHGTKRTHAPVCRRGAEATVPPQRHGQCAVFDPNRPPPAFRRGRDRAFFGQPPRAACADARVQWPAAQRVQALRGRGGGRALPRGAVEWERHYQGGGKSAPGAAGRASAELKGELIPRFVTDNGVGAILDVGSGDGEAGCRALAPRRRVPPAQAHCTTG